MIYKRGLPLQHRDLPLVLPMKTLLFAIGLAFGGILTSFAQAQCVTFTVDSSQSSVSVNFADTIVTSPLSGSAEIALPPVNAPRILALNLVLDQALNFNLFSGFAAANTAAGDVSISMVTPGAQTTISEDTFSQLGNSFTLGGNLNIEDSFGFAGGTQTFDLSTVQSSVDFNTVNMVRVGNLVTITSTFTFTENINTGAADLPLTFDVTYVATGTALDVPEATLRTLGDVNQDSEVDYGDIMPFIGVLLREDYKTEADINQNNAVNFFDIPPFIVMLTDE